MKISPITWFMIFVATATSYSLWFVMPDMVYEGTGERAQMVYVCTQILILMPVALLLKWDWEGK